MSDLPPITSTLPPRKRAKTQEEKEQRRIERILRNRRAAHASREKKRKHVEFLESSVDKLENNIKCHKDKELRLIKLGESLIEKIKALGGDLSDVDVSVLNEDPIPEVELTQPNYDNCNVGNGNSGSSNENTRGSTPTDDNENENEEHKTSLSGVETELDNAVSMDDNSQKNENKKLSAMNGASNNNDTVNNEEMIKDNTTVMGSAISINTVLANSVMSGSAHKRSISENETRKYKKSKSTKASKNADTEIESPMPISPLSTPLIKQELVSPFKNNMMNSDMSLNIGTGFLSNTLDITSTTNSLQDFDESSTDVPNRSSPVSSSSSSVSISNDASVDEYLSNLNNPLYLPNNELDSSSSMKGEFFFMNNEQQLSNVDSFLNDPFDDAHSISGRLHNPAAVFYDF